MEQAIREFTNWVENNCEHGVDGNGAKQSYLPSTKLRDYLDHDRVALLLGTNDKRVNIGKLRHDYLLTFSILVFISKPSDERISLFIEFFDKGHDDSRLPLLEQPDPYGRFLFSTSPAGIEAWNEFYKCQWRFLPLSFLDGGGHHIERKHERTQARLDHIIPITILEELQSEGGGPAKLFKVRPHESSGLSSAPIVLKEYPVGEFEHQFKQEYQTYIAINNIAETQDFLNRYFLRYHGSFIQDKRGTIILEYADKGTLLQLFKTQSDPSGDESQGRALCESLAMLYTGLEIFHRGKGNRSIHQDIQPANIFVFSDPTDTNQLNFKLGDFGLSSTRPPSQMGVATGDNNHGSAMYSAPEICQIDEDLQDSPNNVTSSVDIWSLGCVLFEVAVWMATGESGRVKFCEERVAELSESESFRRVADAGYRGAFHDGFEVIRILPAKLTEISDLNTPVAHLSARIMDFILKNMLVSETPRPSAGRLKEQFLRKLDPTTATPTQARTISLSQGSIGSRIDNRNTRIPETSSRAMPSPRALQNPRQGGSHNPLLQESYETLHPASTAPPAVTNRNDRSLRSPVFSHESLHSAATPLVTVSSVLDWIPLAKANNKKRLESIAADLREINNRDQIFVIDNSKSMMVHWNDVKRTTEALSYLVKRAGKHGFEIRMTNSQLQKRMTRRGKIFDEDGLFDKHSLRESRGPCLMERALAKVLSGVLNEALAPSKLWRQRNTDGVNVYVLTDGVWDGNANNDREEAGGVENAIRTAVTLLQRRNIDRTFLSIQFIRFGENATGERRMAWLDDSIKDMVGGWDIVDTTYHKGEVKKMLVGSMSETGDNR